MPSERYVATVQKAYPIRLPNSRMQVLLEIEQKATFSSQQMVIVKQQMAAKNRESRMLQLTANEVGALPRETHIYEGVGKMYVQPHMLPPPLARSLIVDAVKVRPDASAGNHGPISSRERGAEVRHVQSGEEDALPGDDIQE
jgi:hypothetical protein